MSLQEPCRLRRRLVVRQAKADKDDVFKRTKDVIVKQLDVKEVDLRVMLNG